MYLTYNDIQMFLYRLLYFRDPVPIHTRTMHYNNHYKYANVI